MDSMINLFKTTLFDVIDEFCDRHEEMEDKRIQKWMKFIRREAKKARKKEVSVPTLIAYAMWFYSCLAQMGVMAGLGPSKVNIVDIPKWMDEKLVKKCLMICSSVLTLQFLSR